MSEPTRRALRALPEGLKPLLLALQFLTRIPMPDIGLLSEAQVGRSLLWYPLVGGLLGLLLVLVQQLLHLMLPQQWWVQAALLLVLWVALTGGLHLDGLADSADAWAGGLGDRERTLALMKDPTCGPAAVVWVMLALLLKAALLAALLPLLADGRSLWLLWPLLLARAGVPLLLLTTPYVRPGGLGEALARQLPRRAVVNLLLLLGVLGAGLGWTALLPLLLGLALWWGLRHLMLARIGGTTGDTAGALVELLELALLLGLLLAL